MVNCYNCGNTKCDYCGHEMMPCGGANYKKEKNESYQEQIHNLKMEWIEFKAALREQIAQFKRRPNETKRKQV